MKLKEVVEASRRLSKPYRVTDGKKFRLKDVDPGDTGVVPANNKWFTRVVVAAAVIDALASLNLQYPKVSAAKKQELAETRRLLVASK